MFKRGYDRMDIEVDIYKLDRGIEYGMLVIDHA